MFRHFRLISGKMGDKKNDSNSESIASSKPSVIHILYGSQTGQSESISEIIEEKLKEEDAGWTVERYELDEIDAKFKLPDVRLFILVCSSTGDGDPPDNAAKFYRRLHRKSHPVGTYLADARFALLGLGDTNYSSFLQNPTAIEKRLMILGAKQFYASGWCDDQVGTDLVAEPWMEGLWPAVKMAYGDPNYVIDASPRDTASSSNVGEASSAETSINTAESQSTPVASSENQTTNLTDPLEVKQQKLANAPDDGSPNLGSTDESTKLSNSSSSAQIGHNNSNSADIGKKPFGNLIALVETKISSFSCDLATFAESTDFRRICRCAWPPDSLNNFTLPTPVDELKVPKVSPKFLTIEYAPDQTEPHASDDQFAFDVSTFPSAGSSLLPGSLAGRTQVTTRETGGTKFEIVVDLSCSIPPHDGQVQDAVKYKPGDAFYFVCPNPAEEVDALLGMLSLTDKATQKCRLAIRPDTEKKNPKIPAVLPQQLSPTSDAPGCCLRDIFTHFVDFRKPIGKTLFRILAEHNAEPAEQSRMFYLCSTIGAAAFIDRIVKPRLSLVDILHAYPGCQPPVERLLEHLPRLLPRPYSVASCPEVSGGQIKFVFTLVDVAVGDGRSYARLGLATGYFSSLALGASTSCFLKKSSSFCLPDDPKLATNLIMIGPGTGMAPYLGMLDLIRYRFSNQPGLDPKLAQRWLFFGCRHVDKDFIYRNQLEQYRTDGTLSELSVSFSRMDPDSVQSLDVPTRRRSTPGYVQDALKRYGAELVALVRPNSQNCGGDDSDGAVRPRTVIYVCGDAAGMAKGVHQAWVEMLELHAGLDRLEAEQYVESLKQEGQYLQDIWT